MNHSLSNDCTIKILGREVEIQNISNPTLKAVLSSFILELSIENKIKDENYFNWSDSCDYSDWGDYSDRS